MSLQVLRDRDPIKYEKELFFLRQYVQFDKLMEFLQQCDVVIINETDTIISLYDSWMKSRLGVYMAK